jgi:putative transposase
MRMLETNNELSIRQQAALLDIPRSSLYYKPIIRDDSEVANLIRDIYQASDCRYGYRKIEGELRAQGKVVNNKKVLSMMRSIGLKGLTPCRFVVTTIKNADNKVRPYLLEGLNIKYPDQVWATDITYIKLRERFMYFIAIIDVYSRYVITSELSHSLEAGFCVAALKAALAAARPEIFNTDQGSQFTSDAFVMELTKHDIQISMDHKGRCFDNIFVERFWRTVKQEAIYFYRPETISELEKCLNDFVLWYNHKRLHQSLRYKTPAHVYQQKNEVPHAA